MNYGNKERRITSTSKSESYNHLLDEEYLKDESEARVESHPVEETYLRILAQRPHESE